MSTKGRYGLRVMLELALREGQGPVSADIISESQDISTNYIHNILNILQASGFIQTLRGSKGGYMLKVEPRNVTLLQIVNALEGNLCSVECVTDAEKCWKANRCATREIWSDVTDAVNGVLSKTTLANLVERQLIFNKTDKEG